MFQAAAELNSPEAIYNLGWLRLKDGELEEAIRHFNEALDAQPAFHPAARRLAWFLATSQDEGYRDIDRAEELLDQHYDLKTTRSAAALDTRAVIKSAQGEFELALAMTERAIALERARPQPDESYIADLQQRIQHYQDRKPWTGGSQP